MREDCVMYSLATGRENHRLELIQHIWTIGKPYLQNGWSDCSVRWLEQCVYESSTIRYLQIVISLRMRRDIAVAGEVLYTGLSWPDRPRRTGGAFLRHRRA